jgi:hypothetical protein
MGCFEMWKEGGEIIRQSFIVGSKGRSANLSIGSTGKSVAPTSRRTRRAAPPAPSKCSPSNGHCPRPGCTSWRGSLLCSCYAVTRRWDAEEGHQGSVPVSGASGRREEEVWPEATLCGGGGTLGRGLGLGRESNFFNRIWRWQKL